MTNKLEKSFDSIQFFQKVKYVLAERMKGMTLTEKQKFLRDIREKKIKIAIN